MTTQIDSVATLSSVSRIFKGKTGTVHALDNVSFDLKAGKTLALVGESGSGKTTAARVLLGLDQPTSGSIDVLGRNLGSLKYEELRLLRREIQVVQQDPFSQLNRRHSVERIISSPLIAFNIGDKQSRRNQVIELLKAVGLEEEHLNRRPHELSGGQCQRVAIARALAVDPKIVVLDEAVSALDVSVRAQVLNLLRDIQASRGLTYLFITHDLGVAHYMADEIAVMFRGRIVERGNRDDVFKESRHHYTVGLLSSVPLATPPTEKRVDKVVQSLPSPEVDDACNYRSRCAVGLGREDCKSLPIQITQGSSTHSWLCHSPVVRS
ncbi:MAG: ATP-binding cassette domain-containing protein [Actinobacteria bacterium]|jgi:oligopeptide/dipeptide ABC transporter ATP-binding protein|nr:ATP-binding cassette domain-containing protein [Actinomycetota bacterium]